MEIKKITLYGLAFIVIQIIISCGIFVTFPQMQAYAVSKDTHEELVRRLDSMDKKLDTIITELMRHGQGKSTL